MTGAGSRSASSSSANSRAAAPSPASSSSTGSPPGPWTPGPPRRRRPRCRQRRSSGSGPRWTAARTRPARDLRRVPVVPPAGSRSAPGRNPDPGPARGPATRPAPRPAWPPRSRPGASPRRREHRYWSVRPRTVRPKECEPAYGLAARAGGNPAGGCAPRRRPGRRAPRPAGRPAALRPPPGTTRAWPQPGHARAARPRRPAPGASGPRRLSSALPLPCDQDRQHPAARRQAVGEAGQRGQVGQRGARDDELAQVRPRAGPARRPGRRPAPAPASWPAGPGGAPERSGRIEPGRGQRPDGLPADGSWRIELVVHRLAGRLAGRPGQRGQHVGQLGGLAGERMGRRERRPAARRGRQVRVLGPQAERPARPDPVHDPHALHGNKRVGQFAPEL